MILGCDISKWQYIVGSKIDINFSMVWMKGIRFIIMRGCYGKIIDPQLERYSINSEGIFPVRGIYIYVLWNVSAKEQGELITKLWKMYNIELPPALDLEERSKYPGKDNARLFVKDIVNIIHSEVGQYPLFYTSPGWWSSYGWTDEYFINCPLWIANWNVIKPVIPKPWTEGTFWQWTSRGDGRYYGFHSKGLDLDYYLYQWTDLINLCAGRAVNPLSTSNNTIKHIRKLVY